jgi:hypothetical protein
MERKQLIFIALFLFFTGIFLLIDGIISILIQLDNPLLYHLGRLPRMIIGIFNIVIAYSINKQLKKPIPIKF